MTGVSLCDKRNKRRLTPCFELLRILFSSTRFLEGTSSFQTTQPEGTCSLCVGYLAGRKGPGYICSDCIGVAGRFGV